MPEDNDAMSQSSEGTFFQHSILYTGKFLTRLEDKKKKKTFCIDKDWGSSITTHTFKNTLKLLTDVV